MTTIRRKLAGFLTVVMVFTQLSPAAMAAENDSGVVVVAAAEESAKEVKETKAEPAKAAAEAPAKTDVSAKAEEPAKTEASTKTEEPEAPAPAEMPALSEPSAEAVDPELAEDPAFAKEPDPAWTDESGPLDTISEPSSGEPDQESFSAIVEEAEEDEPSENSGIADAIPVEEVNENSAEAVEEISDAEPEETAVIDAIQTDDDEILSDQMEETETEEENKEAAMPAQELTAEDPSGIKVTVLVPKNTLPENSRAKITLFDENEAREISDIVNPKFTDVLGFDLAFYDAEGNVTEPAEEELEYIVTLPEDQKLASPRKADDPFVILYQDAEGEVKTEQINPENENVDAQSAHFISNHAAPFVIASPEEKDDSTFTAKVKDPSDPSGRKEIQITMTAPAASLPWLEKDLSLQAEVVKAKEAKEYGSVK